MDSDLQPAIPHRQVHTAILRQPYRGVRPHQFSVLCGCPAPTHQEDVASGENGDGVSVGQYLDFSLRAGPIPALLRGRHPLLNSETYGRDPCGYLLLRLGTFP